MKGPVTYLILIGWAVFWLGWLLAAVNVKRGRMSWNRYAGIRLVLVVIIVVLVRGHYGTGEAVIRGAVAEGVGVALWALGLGLAVWARVYLGRNWGMPMSREEDPELVTAGPYRRVRHPIYSGMVLAMIGTAVALSLCWFIVAAFFGVYFAYSARAEERYLTEQFPDAYPAYQRSSKMLIPFIF